MNEEVRDFITHARKKGMDHATIRVLLLSAGWKEREIAEALSAEGLDKPIPLPPDSGGARDAFFHLLNFAALYTVVISLILLFFRYINRLFPDPALEAWRSSGDVSGIRWSMAAVIVAFPLLLWMSRLIHREMRQHPEKAASGIRRWLTYLTLFIAATAIMGDVITLIFSLLEGELSARFLSKVFIILILAGLTFVYYFKSLKLAPKAKDLINLNRLFLAASSGVVVLALTWGAFIVGSPGTEREHKFDDRRLEDLRSIRTEVQSIVYEGRPMEPDREPLRPVPATLEEVRENARYLLPDIQDPESGEPYSYRIIDDTQYQLCAVFTHVRKERYDIFWNHPAGRHCFTIDVTENLR